MRYSKEELLNAFHPYALDESSSSLLSELGILSQDAYKPVLLVKDLEPLVNVNATPQVARDTNRRRPTGRRNNEEQAPADDGGEWHTVSDRKTKKMPSAPVWRKSGSPNTSNNVFTFNLSEETNDTFFEEGDGTEDRSRVAKLLGKSQHTPEAMVFSPTPVVQRPAPLSTPSSAVGSIFEAMQNLQRTPVQAVLGGAGMIATPSSNQAPIISPTAFSSILDHQKSVVKSPKTAPKLQWMYVDPSGKRQGPFSNEQMAAWQQGGYLAPDLPLCYQLGTGNMNFTPLRVLFPDISRAFVEPPKASPVITSVGNLKITPAHTPTQVSSPSVSTSGVTAAVPVAAPLIVAQPVKEKSPVKVPVVPIKAAAPVAAPAPAPVPATVPVTVPAPSPPSGKKGWLWSPVEDKEHKASLGEILAKELNDNKKKPKK